MSKTSRFTSSMTTWGVLSRNRDQDDSGLINADDHQSLVLGLAAKNQAWIDGARPKALLPPGPDAEYQDPAACLLLADSNTCRRSRAAAHSPPFVARPNSRRARHYYRSSSKTRDASTRCTLESDSAASLSEPLKPDLLTSTNWRSLNDFSPDW